MQGAELTVPVRPHLSPCCWRHRCGTLPACVLLSSTLADVYFQLTPERRAHREQPGGGDVQCFCKDQKFEIPDVTEAGFNLGDAHPADVYPQARYPISQFLLCETGPRPQSCLPNTRADEVLAGGLMGLRGGLHNDPRLCTGVSRNCSQAKTTFGNCSAPRPRAQVQSPRSGLASLGERGCVLFISC
ncbi:MAG: hypothetical protein PCFJNLEI_01211 [Verrucomicrobiae bacterium]|nr:hypothetical protein [Verrucomicrobiae bacterium]